MGASSTHTPESHATGGTPDGPPCRRGDAPRGAHAVGDADPRRAHAIRHVGRPRAAIAPAPDRDRPQGGRRGDRAHRERDPRRPPPDPRAAVRDDERDARLERAGARRAGPRSGRALAAPGFDRGGRAMSTPWTRQRWRPSTRSSAKRSRTRRSTPARPRRTSACTPSDGTLHIEIEDRGRGIVPVPDDDPHFGVPIMRARAEALGGYLDVESTPGHGTTVVAELPVARTGG